MHIYRNLESDESLNGALLCDIEFPYCRQRGGQKSNLFCSSFITNLQQLFITIGRNNTRTKAVFIYAKTFYVF